MKITSHKLIKRAVYGIGCLFAAVFIAACTDDSKDLSLGPLPGPDFDIAFEGGKNTVKLINKTSTPSIAYWTVVSTGQKFEGNEATVNFTFKGTYDVTLLVAGKGGTASVTKPVTIEQNDPTACNPEKLLGFLAGCSEKKWKLNPAAGAFKVGPGPDNGSWWSSGAAEITARACEFNDEYTFKFNPEGTFTYDNKGDFFADGYLGKKTTGCEPAANLTGPQAAWNSGAFSFTAIEGGGAKKLGQVRLNGRGAHVGVKKAHNGGETATGPAGDSVTYDVLEISRASATQAYDLVKLGVSIGGDGWWTFTLRSY